jgi:hypothetical protein
MVDGLTPVSCSSSFPIYVPNDCDCMPSQGQLHHDERSQLYQPKPPSNAAILQPHLLACIAPAFTSSYVNLRPQYLHGQVLPEGMPEARVPIRFPGEHKNMGLIDRPASIAFFYLWNASIEEEDFTCGVRHISSTRRGTTFSPPSSLSVSSSRFILTTPTSMTRAHTTHMMYVGGVMRMLSRPGAMADAYEQVDDLVGISGEEDMDQTR